MLNQKIQSMITDLQSINKQKNNFEVNITIGFIGGIGYMDQNIE